MFGEEYSVLIETVKDLRLALIRIPDDVSVTVNYKDAILYAYPDLGLVSLEDIEI